MHALDTLLRLQQLNVAVENEATSSFYENFTNLFKRSLFGKMSQRVTELFKPSDVAHYSWSPKVEQSMMMWADRESYMVLGDVTLFTPVGLKVTYLDYINALEGVLPSILKINDELLQPAIETLGALINNPSLVASKSGLTGKAFEGKLFNLRPEDFAKQISACFDPKSRDDSRKYKELLSRNKDLEVVTSRLAQLQDNLPLSFSKDVEKKMQTVVSLAETLVGQMEVDERYQALSPKVGQLISDQLYRCAVWVEFFAVYQRQVLVLTAALEDSVKKLKKMAK